MWCGKTMQLSKKIHNEFLIKNNLYQYKRNITTKLIFPGYGKPAQVVTKVEEITPNPTENDVLIQVLASPINPVDINIIEGKYPVKKVLPAVAGSEAVGRVIKIGKRVNKFKEGDHVIPLEYNLGTWTTHMILPQTILKKVPTNLPHAAASILMTNPCTVYRMLKDFIKLKEDDIVIQNGSNSSCGKLALQLCNLWGIKTVNIVRNRANIEELKEQLKELGATYVLTEEELKSTDLFKSGHLKKPKLALNCIGGPSSLELLKKLDQEGVLITYGGMSMLPVPVSISALIFRNIKIVGFNINYWNSKCDTKERDRMLDELISLFVSSDLKVPDYLFIKLKDYKEAFSGGLCNRSGKKYIFEIAK